MTRLLWFPFWLGVLLGMVLMSGQRKLHEDYWHDGVEENG